MSNNKIVIFNLKSGHMVRSEITEEQISELNSGAGLTKEHWYEGPIVLGTWSEYCCFDGTQIEKWKIEKT